MQTYLVGAPTRFLGWLLNRSRHSHILIRTVVQMWLSGSTEEQGIPLPTAATQSCNSNLPAGVLELVGDSEREPRP